MENPDKPDKEVVVKLSIKEEIEKYFNEKISHYRQLAKYFMYGLLGFIVLTTTFSLLGGDEVIRILHNEIFPPESPNHIAVSYESLLELRINDPRFHSRSISFYATPTQKVKIYANFIHRFEGEQGQRKVIVTVDNKIANKPITEFKGGFKDITNMLAFSVDFNQEENIHQITFSLDDSQPESLTDEITIICVIIVCGSAL